MLKYLQHKIFWMKLRKCLKGILNTAKMKLKISLKKILLFVNLMEPKQKINVVKDDPDDNKVIECAIESSSDYIITYDKHLLRIKEYKGIKIITPEEFNKIGN